MLVASPAYASGLTFDQINSVLGLFNSFGVNAVSIASVQAALTGQSNNTGRQPGQGGLMGSVVSGTIGANNGSSITIQTANGASTVVNVTYSTTIAIFTTTSTPPTQGSVTDLTVGERAVAEGTQNTDGSLTALHIRAGVFSSLEQSSGSTGGTTGTSCLILTRDLSIGSQGADVANLQKMLAQDPESGFTSTPTGYFGASTAKALARFQAQNGIATATGFAGPLTRSFLQQHCGTSAQGIKNYGNAITGGTISANNTSNISVQAADNTVRVVDITASTTIDIIASTSTPPTQGSVTDLTVGEKVMAEGTLDSDGVLTASRIIAGILQNDKQGSPWQH